MAEEKDWHTAQPAMPKIVCLCGSTRFREEFMAANMRETLAGHIVLMPGHFTHAEAADQTMVNVAFANTKKVAGDKEDYFGPEISAQLEELYRRKIDLCDEVLVLNVDGYIGSSTKMEVKYALSHGKRVRFLVPIMDLTTEIWGLPSDENDYIRASGNVICQLCNQPYKKHPFDKNQLYQGEPWLNILCDNTRVKL